MNNAPESPAHSPQPKNTGWWKRLPIAWLALLTLALVAALPLWGPGMVNTRGGGDSPFLLWRVHQLTANLRAGVFPARWMPDAAYGLGYPFFSYYAALPYYVASLLNLAGLDSLVAIKLTQTLGFVLAAAAAFGWFQHTFSTRAAAWLGAVAYTFAPFHLVNVYVRGDSLSEFYAFVFYPLILWSVEHAVQHRTAKSVIGLGLAYGGLVATHTLSAAIFTPFILLYALALTLSNARLPKLRLSTPSSTAPGRSRNGASFDSAVDRPGCFRDLLTLAASLALGLGLSAWYWLPALLETPYVQPSTLTQGYFYYGNHFRSLDLVQPSLGFVYDTTAEHASPFAMGLVQAIVAGLGIVTYCIPRQARDRILAVPQKLLSTQADERRRTNDELPFGRTMAEKASFAPLRILRIAYWLGVQKPAARDTEHTPGHPHPTPGRTPSYFLLLLLATLMITPLSKIAWDHLPVLPMVQFPWRFLSVQALFAAAAGGLLVESLPAGWRAGAAALAAAALSLAVMLPLQPERLTISADDVSVQRLQLYELFTANIGTTITYEWLPRDVNPRPYTSELVTQPAAPPYPLAVEGKLLSARETAHQPTVRTWTIETETGASLVFPLHYWPGWQASIDGQAASLHPAHSSGRVMLDVPAGQHTVVLQLNRTPLRLAAEILSLAALLLCVGLGACRLSEKGGHTSLPMPQRGRAAISVGYVLIALLLLSILSKASEPTSSTESLDFIQAPYLQRGAVYFKSRLGDRYNTLAGYHLDVGAAIDLSLDWNVVESPLTATLSLVGPGEHLPDLHAPIVLSQSAAQVSPGGSSLHALELPGDLPAGVYLVQLRLAGPDGERPACTAPGAERGWIYLRPVYVGSQPPASDQPVLATFGDRIQLHAVQAEHVSPAQLLVKLDWSASRPIAENYAIALRLYDVRGDRWASLDTQPGHGFLPTTAWRPGDEISDRLMVSLPEGLPPRGDYALEIILYDLADNLAAIGRHVQPGIALTHYARRSLDLPVLAQVIPTLALATLKLPPTHSQAARELVFEAGWLASGPVDGDSLARWSLVDESGHAVAVHGVELDTARWPLGAYVLEAVHLPMPSGLTPGRYHLAVALLAAHSNDEIGRLDLGKPGSIEITGHPRSYSLPPLDKQLGVDLGGQVRLEGYRLAREGNTLRLGLAWRALQAMSQDYTVFVHLVGAGEAIASQHDAMPLGNTYPTSWWLPGEVVSDTIVLSLQGVPPGTWHLAVGMYNSVTSTRLAAYGPDGQRLDADRVVLPQQVQLP